MKRLSSPCVTAYACMKSLRTRGAKEFVALPSNGTNTSFAKSSGSGSLNELVAKAKSANVDQPFAVNLSLMAFNPSSSMRAEKTTVESTAAIWEGLTSVLS